MQVVRRLLAIVLLASLPLTAASAAYASSGDDAQQPVTTENVFFPDERDLTDCLGTLPQPNCGSDARGGWHMYAVMIALASGIAFIGWRVVRGVRANERRAATSAAAPPAVSEQPADPNRTPSSH
jgi:hypothetical protein